MHSITPVTRTAVPNTWKRSGGWPASRQRQALKANRSESWRRCSTCRRRPSSAQGWISGGTMPSPTAATIRPPMGPHVGAATAAACAREVLKKPAFRIRAAESCREPLSLPFTISSVSPVTERLYYTDPYLAEFDAEILGAEDLDG